MKTVPINRTLSNTHKHQTPSQFNGIQAKPPHAINTVCNFKIMTRIISTFSLNHNELSFRARHAPLRIMRITFCLCARLCVCACVDTWRLIRAGCVLDGVLFCHPSITTRMQTHSDTHKHNHNLHTICGQASQRVSRPIVLRLACTTLKL